MTEIAESFRRVAADFGDVIDRVDEQAWSNPSLCDGWTARDVVRHLADWLPGPGFLLGTFGVETGPLPAVDTDDPAVAWASLSAAIQAGLDDPVTAQCVEDCGPLGNLSFEAAVDAVCINDVLVHGWGLARTARVDIRLDASEVAHQLASSAVIPSDLDAAMRASGHFGPRVDVIDDAHPVTRLLAFYERGPA